MTQKYGILRSQLESERKRLLTEMEQVKAAVPPPKERREGSPFGKREEEATESFELEKRLAQETRLKGYLDEVDRALQKFTEGTYGLCDVCGHPIDPARLQALPQATLCVVCKAKQARNGKIKPQPA